MPWDRALCGFTMGWSLSRALGIGLHGLTVTPDGFWAVMSHHVLDVQKRGILGIPEFCRESNRLLAQNFNARLGTTHESFWAAGSYDCVELPERSDVISALVETALLPLSRGLVSCEERYPLVRHTIADARRSIVYARPEPFMNVAAPRPPEVTGLDICLPSVADDDPAAFLAEYEQRYDKRRREVKDGRTVYLGREALEEIMPDDVLELPDIPQDTVCGRSRARWENHFVDSHDAEVQQREKKRLSEFRARYRRCLEELRRRLRTNRPADVVFPAGTWGLPRTLHVRVRGSPDRPAAGG